MSETKNQKEYAESVDGRCHTAALLIIGNLDRRIADLERELAKHQWISVDEAIMGVKYQTVSGKNNYYWLGELAPSGTWFSSSCVPMTTPRLIKPITLPESKGE